MEESILNVRPEDLTQGTCKIFSSNSELRKKYEGKWKIDITKECDQEE